MPPVPALHSRDVVRILESLGWTVARQQASHVIMTQKGHIATLAIPAHKEVAKGTLRSLIRSAGLT